MWLRSVLVLLCGMICVQLGASLLVIALFIFCILGQRIPGVLSPELALFVHDVRCAYHVFTSPFFLLMIASCGKNVCQYRRVVHTGEGGAFMLIRTGSRMFKFASLNFENNLNASNLNGPTHALPIHVALPFIRPSVQPGLCSEEVSRLQDGGAGP